MDEDSIEHVKTLTTVNLSPINQKEKRGKQTHIFKVRDWITSNKTNYAN